VERLRRHGQVPSFGKDEAGNNEKGRNEMLTAAERIVKFLVVVVLLVLIYDAISLVGATK
jgi:hypothetical protein